MRGLVIPACRCVSVQQNLPLLFFVEELDKVLLDITVTLGGYPVVSELFDPYRGKSFAPDHLLSRVAQDLSNLCFTILPNDTQSMSIGALLCDKISDKGLKRQRSTYSTTNRSLYNMKVSDVFCVLNVSVAVYRTYVNSMFERCAIAQKVLKALEYLQELVAKIYCWPWIVLGVWTIFIKITGRHTWDISKIVQFGI